MTQIEIEPNAGAARPSTVLAIDDLRVSFSTPNGAVQAVRGVDFRVGRGELLGVVGESGSGKSVTFLSVLGLLARNATVEGSATVGGVQLIGANNRTMRDVRGKRVAMIFQDPLSALNPVHRVGRQIVEMIQAHQPMSTADAHRRAVELLDVVGIPQPAARAKQYPHEFSGGMRQRVMIAMAIANDPEVLIADEPTTALDVTVQAQILEVIQRIRRDLGTAVVLITHDLGVVARVADNVQVMYAGRVAERNDVLSLYSKPGHPYTKGLLNSLPTAGGGRLRPIPGAPPNMLRPPSGCAFRTRCVHATDVCQVDPPPSLAPVSTGGETACVRVQPGELEL